MGYYIDKNVNITELYKYDTDKYDSKKEFNNYIASMVISLIITLSLLLVIKFYLNIRPITFILITGIVLIIILAFSSFLFNGHNIANKRFFAYGDGRLFIIELVPENNRQIIGISSNIIKSDDLNLEQANKIINSKTPMSYYAYEILDGKSFLITPQGIGYKFTVRKKIYYEDNPTSKISNMKINVSNRYMDYSNLLMRIENLKY